MCENPKPDWLQQYDVVFEEASGFSAEVSMSLQGSWGLSKAQMDTLETEANGVIPDDPSIDSDFAETELHQLGTRSVNALQSALSSHLKELQRCLDDWSERQQHIINSVVVAGEEQLRGMQDAASKPVDAPPATIDFHSEANLHSPGNQTARRDSRTSSSSHASKPSANTSRRGSVDQLLALGTGALRGFIFEKEESLHVHMSRSFHSSWIDDIIRWGNEKFTAGEIFVHEGSDHNCLTKWVLSSWFDGLSATIIIVNAAYMGYTADYAMQHLEAQSTDLFLSLDLAFVLYYLLEILLRIIVLRWFYIFSPDWRWNFFDVFLVVSGLSDQIQERFGGGAGSNTYALRMLRIQKMVKILRMVRVLKKFRELRTIFNLIIGSMKTMAWTILMVCFVCYVLGVVFLQSATTALEDSSSEDSTEGIKQYWGSLSDSMLSLYASAMGGVDWSELRRSLENMAIKFAERDEESMIQAEFRKKHEYVGKIRAMFARMAKSDESQLFQDDVITILADPSMIAFMSNLEIEAVDVERFFNVLSHDGKHGIDIETFVVGCMKMRGYARSMDLQGLIHTQAIVSKQIHSIAKELRSLKEDVLRLLPAERRGLHAQSFARLPSQL